MDDPLMLAAILAGSAAAISALILLNRWLGGWTPSRLDSLADAGERLGADVVGFRPGAGALATDRLAALVREEGGDRLGLVIARGDRYVTRALAPGELLSVRREGRTLTLHIADFTLSRVGVTLEDEAAARDFETLAKRLTRETARHARTA